MQSRKMQVESPIPSPDVTCYEECVVAEEEVFISPSTDSNTNPDLASPVPRTNKNLGRVTKKSRSRSRSVKEKKFSSPLILKWLDENYEMIPGACLPRSVLYTHYQDFCKRNLVEPSSAASFGKIIRMKFPNLSTRRLGTRGQSKYHYYGLAIKETSIYYRSVYSKQGLTRFSGASLKRENSQLYNPTSKTGILLPEFPKISELNIAKPFPIDKVETFLLMYRAHCQRILDSVVRANFHEVNDFLVHFWQGMPQHMLPILNCQATVDLVVICDFILYNRLCEVLIPASLQPLPDNLVEETLSFSHKLVEWLFGSLQDLPAPLGIRKVQTAEMFGKSLRRQTALVQLAKGARNILRSSESVGSILNDWRSIDFEAAASQIIYTHHLPEKSLGLYKEFSTEMEQLLVKQSSLEVYFEWLDSLIERKVCEPAERGVCSLEELSQDFLISWNNFYLIVEKEVMYIKGKSFDYYRLVHAVLNEYIHHVTEVLHFKVIESQFNRVFISGGNLSKSLELPQHPPKLDAGDCISLPPIFPPTPTSASSDKDFINYFENRISHEYQDTSLFPAGNTLQSPTYMNMHEGVYDGFFKQESLYHQPSCLNMPPSSLSLEDITPQHAYNHTPPPLTPQSSYCSSSSPISHISVHSPESLSMTPELETARPVSQGSMYNLESPHVGDVSLIPYSNAQSESGSACTSPLQHTPVTSNLDIAASLDLVAGHNPVEGQNGFIHHNGYTSIPPTLYSVPAPKSTMAPQYQLPSIYSPATPPIQPCGGYMHGMNGYPQYDFELHHLMSDPSELLTEAITDIEDTKPSITSLSLQACTPSAII